MNIFIIKLTVFRVFSDPETILYLHSILKIYNVYAIAEAINFWCILKYDCSIIGRIENQSKNVHWVVWQSGNSLAVVNIIWNKYFQSVVIFFWYTLYLFISLQKKIQTKVIFNSRFFSFRNRPVCYVTGSRNMYFKCMTSNLDSKYVRVYTWKYVENK